MTDAAEVIRSAFAVALDIDISDVDDDADFFLYGGHSLSAAGVAATVEDALGVQVSTQDVFDHPTPGALAAIVVDRAPLPVTGDTAPDEMAWLWMERQQHPDTGAAYTVPCLLEADRPLDLDRLREAVHSVVLAHPALRRTFAERDGAPFPVTLTETSSVAVVDVAEGGRDRVVDALIREPFDLAEGPLFRVTVLRETDARALLITADHLVCDGRSLDILAADLAAAYADPSARIVETGPVAGRVARDTAVDHWRRTLVPPPPAPALPVVARRSGPVGETAIVSADADAGLVAEARSHGRAGPFAPFGASVAVALADIAGIEDVCLGTAIDRRTGPTDRRVGFHVASVPLRVSVPQDRTPGAVVEAVSNATVAAIDHAAVSFAEIVAELDPPREPWRNPYFDVWVAVYPRVDTGPSGQSGVRLRGGPVPLPDGLFELSFQFTECEDGSYRIVLQYDVSRYDEQAARRLVDRVHDRLRWIAGYDAPEPERTAVFAGFQFG